MPALTESELSSIHPHLVTSTALWYYVLKQAETFEDCNSVRSGGESVAEVFIGLVKDPKVSHEAAGVLRNARRVPGEFHALDLLMRFLARGRRR